MKVSIYHRFLRSSLLIMTAVLLFDSGMIFPVTKQLSDNTIVYLASVGSSVVASVPPNEINMLSAEIAAQKRELDQREAALNEREIKSRFTSPTAPDYSIFVISAILFIILVLLILNYVLDFTRARKFRYESKTI